MAGVDAARNLLGRLDAMEATMRTLDGGGARARGGDAPGSRRNSVTPSRASNPLICRETAG